MSARTRSSTRKQVLQDPEESDNSKGSDAEIEAERPFNLEEKEQEIWDEVRDEHYDIIEQLPLTIHRQLTLLHQLDCQAHDYADSLLPTVKQYIQLRHQLAQNESKPVQSAAEADQNSSPPAGSPDGHTPTTTSACDISVLSVPARARVRLTPASTREMLSHIGQLSEEYLRTSREKVNIAQTAQDLVDRQIRLLDQFIKEQEVSLGPEPNAPVMLSMSELVVPKWSRPTRVSMSPMPDDVEEKAVPPGPPIQAEASIPPERPSKRRPLKKTKNKEKEREKEEQSVPPALKITLPPPHPDIIDPNEPTWCYCNRISFGEMIGCDDPECKYEWFHLECVGLNEVPEDDEWYCRECAQRREAKNKRR